MANDEIRTMNELRYNIDHVDIKIASSVCRGLEEYAKTLPLNNNTIIEFYEFSILFFDRIFGEDITNRSIEDLPKSWKPYRCGGWFRLLTDNKGVQIRQNNNSFLSTEAYSLYQVLSINSSLMDVLRRGNKNFDLDVKMLPFKVRMLLQENLSQIGSPVKINEILQFVESPNLAYLQSWFLNPKVLSPRKDKVILSPFKYFLTCLLRYPTLDEYIFYPRKQIFSPQKYLGVPQVLQFNPYLNLVRHYLDALLGRGNKQDVEGSLSPESEWFLRLAVEYWLNPADVVRMRSESFNTKKYRDVRLLRSPGSQVLDQYNPLTVTLFDDNPPDITTPSLQCCYLLLQHLMSDPNLSQHCETLARNNEKAASANANTSVSPRAVDYGALVSLPKPVYILQQPLFDLLRVVFSRGDHSIYSALTFHNAVQLWLVYIQPWKAVSITGENIENGPYKPDWDYFIASNLHFYTTLLALFLRTVSLSSLNPTDAYGRPFLDTLDKVLRVFSGLLLTTINDLTSEFNSWYEYEIKQKLSQRPTHSASRSGKGSSKTPTSARTPLYSPLTLNSRASLDHDSSSTPVSVELAAIRLAIKCQHQYLFPDYNDNYFINAASMLKHGDNISVIPVITKVCAQYGENLHTSLRRLLRVTPDSYALQAWEGYIEFFKLNGNSNNLVHLHHDIENMMTQLRIVLNRPAASLLRANSSYDPSSDVLDRPTTASEWSALVLVTVGVSKFLNSILDLPRDSYLVNMELQEAIDYIRHQHKDIKAQAVALLHSARFNFRGLANITVSVVITLIFIVRFFIYVSFGWFTVWQMIRNIAAPFIVTTILRLVEHWYRVESKHVSDTTDRGFVVWDNQTGKLTDYGKEMLLQGQLECKKENLRFIGDELTLPCHTFEYSFLYHLGVKLSQYLNTRYRLPINTDDISLPWKIIIKSAWMNRRNQNPLIMISQALRFNLRFLASKHYLFWGFLMLVLSYVFFPLYLKIVIAMSVLMLVSLIVTLERRLVK